MTAEALKEIETMRENLKRLSGSRGLMEDGVSLRYGKGVGGLGTRGLSAFKKAMSTQSVAQFRKWPKLAKNDKLMRTEQITVTPNKNAPIYTAQFHAWLYNELKEYIDKKIISIFYSSAYGCVVTLRDTPSEELRLLEMSPLMSRDDLLFNIKLWIRLKTSDAKHHDRP